MAQTVKEAPSTSPGSGSAGVFGRILLALVAVAVIVAGTIEAINLFSPDKGLPDSTFQNYEEFWNQYAPQGLPPDLSVDRVRARANECSNGTSPPNKPEYAAADQYGRAQGGWVCLVAPVAGVVDTRCPALGTNTWRRTNGLPQLRFVEEGHLVGKSLGGDGSATINGACVNMAPQSSTPNRQMGRLAEAHAVSLVNGAPGIEFYYQAVAVYTDANYMPIGIWIFIVSEQGAEAIGPFLNEQHNIDDIGGAA